VARALFLAAAAVSLAGAPPSAAVAPRSLSGLVGNLRAYERIVAGLQDRWYSIPRHHLDAEVTRMERRGSEIIHSDLHGEHLFGAPAPAVVSDFAYAGYLLGQAYQAGIFSQDTACEVRLQDTRERLARITKRYAAVRAADHLTADLVDLDDRIRGVIDRSNRGEIPSYRLNDAVDGLRDRFREIIAVRLAGRQLALRSAAVVVTGFARTNSWLGHAYYSTVLGQEGNAAHHVAQARDSIAAFIKAIAPHARKPRLRGP
jgi:hypothetical protein